MIQNEGNHLCLNNYHGLDANETPQNMWSCNPDDYRQNYILSGQGGGIGIRVDKSNLSFGSTCLSSFGYTLDGSYVKTFGCNGSANQTWGSD